MASKSHFPELSNNLSVVSACCGHTKNVHLMSMLLYLHPTMLDSVSVCCGHTKNVHLMSVLLYLHPTMLDSK